MDICLCSEKLIEMAQARTSLTKADLHACGALPLVLFPVVKTLKVSLDYVEKRDGSSDLRYILRQ